MFKISDNKVLIQIERLTLPFQSYKCLHLKIAYENHQFKWTIQINLVQKIKIKNKKERERERDFGFQYGRFNTQHVIKKKSHKMKCDQYYQNMN